METQEISGEFLFKAWPWIEAHRRQLIGGVIGVAVLVGIISVVSAARGQKEISAGIALSKLLTTPPVDPEALLQLASAQSGTQAALRAQLQAATAYFEDVTRLGTQISIGSEAYQHLAIIKQKLAVKPAAAK